MRQVFNILRTNSDESAADQLGAAPARLAPRECGMDKLTWIASSEVAPRMHSRTPSRM